MTQLSDYDSPWNEPLAHYLSALLQLCFSEAHADIDWSRGYHLGCRPAAYVTQLSGCASSPPFPSVKLLDPHEAALSASANPSRW